MAAKKNSLVNNINRRKRAGTSRPKSSSTVSGEAYDRMEAGWPSKSKKAAAKKKSSAKKSSKKKAAKKTVTRRSHPQTKS